MKTKSKLLGMFLFAAFIAGCTKVTFDSPIDSRGNQYLGDQYAADSDGNGIANYYDPKSPLHPKDTIPPVISFTDNQDTIRIPVNDPNNLLNTYKSHVKAIDKNDGDITSKIIETPNYQIFKDGTGTLTYSVSDSAGNSAQKIRYVVIYTPSAVDKTPPVITLLNKSGDTLKLFTTDDFTDPGAIAIDDIDGDVTKNIQKTGTVDVKTPGTYHITYTVSDKAGNKATAVLTVIVTKDNGQDLDAPVITLKGRNPDSVKINVSWKDPGYTAYDSTDGDITSKVTTSGKVDSSKAGICLITYRVSDKAGNSTTKTRTVVVGDGGNGGGDQTPPVIILNGKAFDTIQLNSTYTDPGVKSAFDDFDAVDYKSKIVPTGTVDTKTAGTYTITYSATDKAGNTGSATRKVTVLNGAAKDTIKPVITIKGKNPDTVMLNSGTYTDPGATALDNKDGDITLKIKPTGVVDATKAGKDTISYSVSDSAGNTAKAIRIVIVRDTSSSNLLSKYGVESAKALPATMPSNFTHFTKDGTAPDLSNLKSLNISWSNSQLYYFGLGYVGPPNSKSFSPTNTFASAKPTLTLSGTSITGLDTSYYVVFDGTNFVWVSQDGTFAIIWAP